MWISGGWSAVAATVLSPREGPGHLTTPLAPLSPAVASLVRGQGYNLLGDRLVDTPSLRVWKGLLLGFCQNATPTGPAGAGVSYQVHTQEPRTAGSPTLT